MSVAASLIPELEQVLSHGSPQRCAEMLSGITGLFLSAASRFNEDHVELFDAVFARLIEDIEARALTQLSLQLAPVENAPPKLVRRLANDDNIAVAAPMLRQSPRLADSDLREIAAAKGQAHLLVISARRGLGQSVTDVLVQRDDREVDRTVAKNPGAKLSEKAFSTLVERAAEDGILAERVGQRRDIPPRLFRTLLLQATEVVQRRLLAKARPETAAEIRRVLAKVSEDIGAKAPAPRNYTAAEAAVFSLRQENKLNEGALSEFANKGKFEETVAATSELAGVPIETVERLMLGERPDPVLILGKATGFGWPTVRAMILVRPGGKGTSTQALDAAYGNFERLSITTAQRVTRFWQIRHGAT